MSEEPERPKPSRAVAAWLDRHVPMGMSLEAVTDAPPAVAAWLAQHADWLRAREIWASRQPIDYDLARTPRGCWRMFGGEWIADNETIEGRVGDARCIEHALGAAQDASLRLTPEAFRAWALARMHEHTMAACAETARSIAALAEWPPTAASAAAVADHALYAKRHADAAKAYERVVDECDALIAKLTAEAP